MLTDLIIKNRSYRRFYGDYEIDRETLKGFIDLARLTPSAGNLQPLKFFISNDPETNALIYPNLKWAGYLKDWDGPALDERPSAYIIILGDRTIKEEFIWDKGIAAQTIMLGAAEMDLGGCILASIDKEGIAGALRLPDRFEVLLVLAIGKPKETVVLEEVGPDGNIEYYRDENGGHHVPKRSLEELIIN